MSCGTSSSGLDTKVGVETTGLRKLLCSADGLIGDNVSRQIGECTEELGTGRNASAYHSYHTLRTSVNRHSDTVSSESAGRYKGSYRRISTLQATDAETPYLQRDEEREPAQHVLRDLGHAVRVYA